MTGRMARAVRPDDGLPRGLLPLVAVDLRQVSLQEGLRAGLAVASLVALNAWLDWPPLSEAALAALFTCLCDAGGPIRRRVPPLLAFACLGAAITVGFGVLRNAPLPVVVPVASASVFCLAFARVLGQSAMLVGNLLTVVLVLALTRAIGSAAQAAALAGGFALGSGWALLLTLVVWRIHPYRPARRAVADALRGLGDMARDIRDRLHDPEPADPAARDAAWDRHARFHRRRVREALERARTAVLETVRVRGPVRGPAAESWLRLEAAEGMFGALIALSDRLARTPDASRADPATAMAADGVLRRLRALLIVLAHAVEMDQPLLTDRLERAAAAVAAVPLPDPVMRASAAAIAERLRVAITLAAPPGWSANMALPAREPWLPVLRANLAWSSVPLRHALRAATAAAVAFGVTLGWPGPYEHWLTIMFVLTMQPYLAVTLARALERIGASVVGGLAGAGIAALCTTPLSMAAAVFPLAAAALALRPASFGLFMTCLTPLVILLAELGRSGDSALVVAGMRALYTLLGGGLAVAASLLLWPSWEPARIGADLTAAIRAHAGYARAAIAALLGETGADPVEAARRQAGLASNNLEAGLHRAMLEPGWARAGLEGAFTVDAALRRVAGRVAALRLAPAAPRDAAAWQEWSDWLGVAAAAIASRAPVLPPRPKLPDDDPQADTLARIARQFELCAGAVRRLPAPGGR